MFERPEADPPEESGAERLERDKPAPGRGGTGGEGGRTHRPRPT